ncbi:MAG: glycosyltransferase family 2 protein [Methanobacteriota archaeon]
MVRLITIGIPAYKRADYLKEAVHSALTQTYTNIEVLISQNPSTESITKSIRSWCKNLEKKDSRVRYQENTRNLGMGGNWNAIADSAKGEFLILLADDDMLLPDFVKKTVNAIQSNTSVVFANNYMADSHGRRLEKRTVDFVREYHRDCIPAGPVENPEICAWQSSIPIVASLIRTSDVRRIRFLEDVNIPEATFFIELAKEGGNFVFVPEYLSEYRVHTQSTTAQGLENHKRLKYMKDIPATPDIEQYKQDFISNRIINAVNCCLIKGDWDLAREFINSKYYTQLQKKSIRGRIQSFLLRLPPSIGSELFRFLKRIKNRLLSLGWIKP